MEAERGIEVFLNSPDFITQTSDFSTRLNAGELIQDISNLTPESRVSHVAHGILLGLDNTPGLEMPQREANLSMYAALLLAQQELLPQLSEQFDSLISGQATFVEKDALKPRSEAYLRAIEGIINPPTSNS